MFFNFFQLFLIGRHGLKPVAHCEIKPTEIKQLYLCLLQTSEHSEIKPKQNA